MSASQVLLQFGADPFSTRFEDIESRPAFSVGQVASSPNLVIKVTRETTWAQHHPTIMGPDNSFFYFGPTTSPGYIVYGNGPSQAMSSFIRQKKEGSTSRYFTGQNGKEYKWKITRQRMECIEGRSNSLAVWELSEPEDEFDARLTIKQAGLPIITEILTSLTINRMARTLNW